MAETLKAPKPSVSTRFSDKFDKFAPTRTIPPPPPRMVLDLALQFVEAKGEDDSWTEGERTAIKGGAALFGAIIHVASDESGRRLLESAVPKGWKNQRIYLDPSTLAVFKILLGKVGDTSLEKKAAKLEEKLPLGKRATLTYNDRGLMIEVEGEPGELVDLRL